MSLTLKKTAAHGALWAGMQAVINKAVGFGAQIVLAWFLFPQDFGLLAMAQTLMTILSQFQGSGIRAVLVQRSRGFRYWATPAFWLSLFLGLIVFGFALAFTPLLVSIYNEPRLWALVPVMAAGLVIDSLIIVPSAALQSALKLRTLVTIQSCFPIGQAFGSMGLAYAGFGALSIVIPRIPIGIVVLFVMWRKSGLKISFSLRLSRWRFLIGKSFSAQLGVVGFIAAAQAPVYFLSRMHDAAQVGRYYFATMITSQVIAVFTLQLDAVLLPTFSKMGRDLDRRWRAFRSATSVLAVLISFANCVSFCVAPELIHIIFHGKWDEAIVYVQILTIGTSFLGVAIPSGSVMMSMGKFDIYLIYAWASFLVAVTFALVASLLFGAIGVVTGVALYQIVISLVGWFIVARLLRGSGWLLMMNLALCTAPFAVAALIGFSGALIAPVGWSEFALRIALFGAFSAIFVACLWRRTYRSIGREVLEIAPPGLRRKLANIF